MYRPLPSNVTIKSSSIHGLGLFALEDIPIDYEFGISHVSDDRFENSYIRTPLGGFFNHSDEPNCETHIDRDFIKLRSTKNIEAGEEITVKYWLYGIKQNEA